MRSRHAQVGGFGIIRRRALSAIVIIAVLFCGCGGRGGSNNASSGKLSVSSNCTSAFSDRTYSDLPHGASPSLAVRNFLLHGSLRGALAPVVHPVDNGYPKSGWKESNSEQNSITFKSGLNVLHVVKMSANVWEVDGGALCVAKRST
jgi:hypothetical protein